MGGGAAMGLGVQRRLGGRGTQQQQGLFPVQVMMPVGPQGTWQPVQYMMTAHQVQQFYNSVQFNPHPQHAPTSTTREGNQVRVLLLLLFIYLFYLFTPYPPFSSNSFT